MQGFQLGLALAAAAAATAPKAISTAGRYTVSM